MAAPPIQFIALQAIDVLKETISGKVWRCPWTLMIPVMTTTVTKPTTDNNYSSFTTHHDKFIIPSGADEINPI